MSEENKQWEIVQTLNTITPGNAHFSLKSLRAKLMNKDGIVPSQMPENDALLAHANSSMTCYSCHTSWTPTCFGCHLQMTANARKPMLHNEGLTTRNYTSYNFQVLRDDIFMLGVDGTVTGHRIAPARSSCAVLVSSQNASREWLYYTQQTISAPGFSGQAFSTFVPHTVRARETKQCSDCHVSAANDNNAWMAQLLLQGTNLMNFLGRYVYVATGNKGFEGVAVAEHDEPEAIFGSDLHRIAYPANYKQFLARNRELTSAYEHTGNVLDIQARGEYAYAATGAGGLRVYDIANIDNKGFSERVTTAPFSPLGQRFFVPKNAQAIASPSTLAIDPLRAISKGIDRDRAVDESGNQLAVFGRRGARPLNRAEALRLYIHSRTGEFYSVADEPVEHPYSSTSSSISFTSTSSTSFTPLTSFWSRARDWLKSFR